MERGYLKARKPIRVAVSDEELIQRLQDEKPEALEAAIPEAKFNAAVEGLLKESPSTQERPYYYCRKCGQYRLKSHRHHD
jgi:hypothetical protein